MAEEFARAAAVQAVARAAVALGAEDADRAAVDLLADVAGRCARSPPPPPPPRLPPPPPPPPPARPVPQGRRGGRAPSFFAGGVRGARPAFAPRCLGRHRARASSPGARSFDFVRTAAEPHAGADDGHGDASQVHCDDRTPRERGGAPRGALGRARRASRRCFFSLSRSLAFALALALALVLALAIPLSLCLGYLSFSFSFVRALFIFSSRLTSGVGPALTSPDHHP